MFDGLLWCKLRHTWEGLEDVRGVSPCHGTMQYRDSLRMRAVLAPYRGIETQSLRRDVWDLLCAISHIRLAFYCYNLGKLAVITILIDKLGHPVGLPGDNEHFDWSPAVQLGLEHPARVCIRLDALKMKDFPDANELFWRNGPDERQLQQRGRLL